MSLDLKAYEGLIENVRYPIANLANTSAFIYDGMEDLNWAGFYLAEGDKLVLGPFQGKIACIEIAKGRGVCGTAMAEDKTQRVADVHSFPGHIACDCASRSEIVIPVHVDGKIYGVLDLDSTREDRFSKEDQDMLEKLVGILEARLARKD